MIKDNEILKTENFDVGGIKLTEKEKLFVFWYTYPNVDSFMNQTKAAEKAGYKKACFQGYRLRGKEHVAKAIKYVLDTKLKKDLEEEYFKIIEIKKARIHFDIADYVKINDDGIEEFKNLKDLTETQRMAIDSIDYKGMEGIKTYNFANRDVAMADIIKLYKEMQQKEIDNIEDGELTAEIIKEGLILRVLARKKKTKIEDQVDYVDAPECEKKEL